MTQIREDCIRKLWHGSDPWANYALGSHPTDYQGWASENPFLARAIEEMRPAVVVEVGVWKGGSVITMANRMKALGLNGVVIAVDTFLGSAEHWVDPKWHADLRFAGGYPQIFHTFATNIATKGLQEYVLPLPLDSITASQVIKQAGIPVDVLHIDGGHDRHSVLADLNHWWPLLRSGGVLLGDDYFTDDRTWQEVRWGFREFFSVQEDLENFGGKCWVRKP